LTIVDRPILRLFSDCRIVNWVIVIRRIVDLAIRRRTGSQSSQS